VENLAYASVTAVSVLGWLVSVRLETIITSCTRSRVPKVPETIGDESQLYSVLGWLAVEFRHLSTVGL
jgi:hypothetical protein